MIESDVLRALVVDDEATARRTIRRLLEEDPEIEIVGEAWGRSACTAIEELNPDIVFLDIQMPGMDGFEVLDSISRDQLPTVIFITAYDEYALPAFEVRAVDYLVKPFTDQRFREATERAKDRLRQHSLNDLQAQIAELLELRREPAPSARTAWQLAEADASQISESQVGKAQLEETLLIRDGSRTHLVRYGDIDWIEGAGTYVRIHEGERNRLVRTTLSHLASELGPYGFFRIHRSSIVNLARVVELRHLSHGDYQVVLEDDTRLRLSRSRREDFEEMLADLTHELVGSED